jgi:hypothetical protein
MSWEHRISFAAADGSCATAELQPESLAPGRASGKLWQAAYAAGVPVGRQPWKRLRVS